MSGSAHQRRAGYGPWIVATLFMVSGSLHLIRPAIFTPMVPQVLPWRTELVYASGVVELICSVGLLRRDRWAGIAAAVLLVAIWPGNLQAAITAQRSDDQVAAVLSWIRVPLQIPLVWLALQSGRNRRNDLPPDPHTSTSRWAPPSRTPYQEPPDQQGEG